MAPRLITVDASLATEAERRTARGEQQILSGGAAGGPALRASASAWLTTGEAGGETAVSRVGLRRRATHDAPFDSDCDEELYFGKEPGMACTARIGEGMQAQGLAFEGTLPPPKMLPLVDAARKKMRAAERTTLATDLVKTEAFPPPLPPTAPAVAAAAGSAGAGGGTCGGGGPTPAAPGSLMNSPVAVDPGPIAAAPTWGHHFFDFPSTFKAYIAKGETTSRGGLPLPRGWKPFSLRLNPQFLADLGHGEPDFEYGGIWSRAKHKGALDISEGTLLRALHIRAAWVGLVLQCRLRTETHSGYWGPHDVEVYTINITTYA
jgi:hypothetical protein